MKKIFLENINKTSNSKSDKNDIFRSNDDFIIESGSVLNVAKSEVDDKLIASVAWLLKSKSGKLFTLSTNYIIEDVDDELFINNIPFNKESFAASKITDNMIINELPGFITDMEFSISDLKDPEEYNFSIEAFDISSKDDSNVTFYVNIELFSSFKFIDNYITDMVMNNYDMMNAILSAAYIPERKTEFFIVENVSRISSLSLIDKKTSSVAVVFEVDKKLENCLSEMVSLLVPFNLNNIKFSKSKFKGSNIKKIQDVYMTESGQYINIFTFTCKFKNIDTEYMCIKAKNKDQVSKLFILNKTNVNQLEEMIKAY